MQSNPIKALKGQVTIPGDKSISHRAIMLGAIAEGATEITNFLQGADCLSTIQCFRQMGITIENTQDKVVIYGKGLRGLHKPDKMLDTGNSGTTTRLISGILAPQNFTTAITGDESIQRRPMDRIITPLEKMGASIISTRRNCCVPLLIEGRHLKGIHYHSPVASAQVKSAILLAGLYAAGETSVTEPNVSRNHTELMLRYFGARVSVLDTTAVVYPLEMLAPQKIEVPGDISSAAYFMAAGALVPNSEILIKNVGLNPTRSGMIKVMKGMGANLTIENEHMAGCEPAGDIVVKSSSLKGVTIGGSLIPALIDELPIIAILAAFADGKTVIKDAQELKVKESNRIQAIVDNLSAMGASIVATDDGMIIEGGAPLHGANIDSRLDHRIAMSFTIASLAAQGDTKILGKECVNISYPGFYEDLEMLIQP